MRSCPRCSVALQPSVEGSLLTGRLGALAGGAVQVDACPNCSGRFLDRGEVGLLTGALGIDRILAPPRQRHIEGGRCPECASAMAFREVRGLIVDACPGCGGFWFDRGEIQDLRRVLAAPR